MRRWIAWSAKLYPRRWRERYGVEFDALMEEVEPDWHELLNVLGGALKMQIKSETAYWKLAAILAAIGAAVALGMSLRLPPRYVSTARLQVTVPPSNQQAAVDIQTFQSEILSRASLAELIQRPTLNLYAGERQRLPLIDVVERMRSDIQITRTDGGLNIAFAYPDREKARSVVRELVTKFTELNAVVNRGRQTIWQRAWKEDAPPGVAMAVISPASDAISGGQPDRIPWAIAGVLAGVLFAAIWRWPRTAWKLGAFAAGGALLAAGVSLLIPNRYTSVADLRIMPPVNPQRWYAYGPAEPVAEHVDRIKADLLSDDSLKELILRPSLDLYRADRATMSMAEVVRRMRERDVQIEARPPFGFRISFTYTDPLIAQAVEREFVTKTFHGYISAERKRILAIGGELQAMAEYKYGENIEVLDPASLPQTPVSPNRLIIIAIGLTTGLLLGIAALVIRRPRGHSTQSAVAAPAV
jgi:capsular polysaccharide biosynthesis protein